ncbi:hypothetical protein APH_0721 [Anaplasma phagocytophilum str. HZ]|uniref:Uncharacterized protein n=1 Tax=Anaplasma phagocytophilum (strain HZ) TaxID=212042 RepID=Q2GJZ9_ANAPZ|nr:hypothetical protein APH_0721 [Anaplasma phagocytophilum str. HZ]
MSSDTVSPLKKCEYYYFEVHMLYELRYEFSFLEN